VIEKIAGSNTDIEMASGNVALVECQQFLRLAPPNEPVGKPVYECIVKTQDKGIINSMPGLYRHSSPARFHESCASNVGF
jgi:hypothetical protein